MNIVMIVPRVIESYYNKFPEVRNNAYRYFNYDNRVVEERVYRGDVQRPYVGPDDITDADYGALIQAAKTGINPVLAKYSAVVACEDALSMAIRSFRNGFYDSKINAGRFQVLLGEMMKSLIPHKEPVVVVPLKEELREAGKEKKKVDVKKVLTPHILKQLGLKPHQLPRKDQTRGRVHKGIPHLVRTDKGVEVNK